VTLGPGDGPPALPPVEPPQPPRGRRPDPLNPVQSSPRQQLIGGLAVALAVSLAMNAILALRIKVESDQQAQLRAQVSQLQAEVDALRKTQPAGSATILDTIAAAVTQLRQLAFKKKVAADVLTDAQLRDRVEEQFKKDNPRADVDAQDDILTSLGLLKPSDDLFDILLSLHTEQVAGFYDTKTKKLVVGGDAKNPTPLDRVLLAHEYVHAVTDQHFDLTRLDRLQDQRKDDEILAYLSLVEGDATVMMGEYAQKYLTPSEQRDYISASTAAPRAKFDESPAWLQRALIFPYDEGSQFVQTVLEQGGIKALNDAYVNPPTSTEQILHTSKYLSRRDEPTDVAMPDLTKAMGSGWHGLPGGEMGEFDLQVIIDQFLSRSDAERAASGWDGGGYVAAEASGGAVVAVLTVWDSESEARDATETIGRWLPVRYENQGGDMRLTGISGRGWSSPAGAGEVLRSGTQVLFVVGPDAASVEKARNAFSGF